MFCIIHEGDFIGSEKCKTEKALRKFFDRLIHNLGEKFTTVLFKRGNKTFVLKSPND